MLGAALATTSFTGAVDDRNLVDDLRDHGTRVPAVVTDIDYGPKSGRTDVAVRFDTGKDIQTHSLLILDTVPPVREGEQVEVVFDPTHPGRVLMPQQQNYGHAHLSNVMGWVFIGVASSGVGWWAARAPARSRKPA